MIPSEERLNAILKTAATTFAKPTRDYLKQDCFYVSINENAELKSNPSAIDKRLAQQRLDEAENFKVVVEVLAGQAPAGKVGSALTFHSSGWPWQAGISRSCQPLKRTSTEARDVAGK